jgi:DNA-binding SARP family transcriptional activator
LHLFGSMRIVTARASTVLAGPNGQRLVGYLALHPAAHRREALADLLWPDLATDSARRRLSDTLYRLRTRLEAHWIESDDEAIALDGRLWVDVWEFDRLSAAGAPGDLERAVALHTSDLLPGVYDDWVVGHRAARRQALVAALERLVAAHELAGDLARALGEARRLIVAEPLHESAHQTYLRLLGRLRRYGEATAHLEQMQALFRAELGVSPLPETIRIVQQMLVERDVVLESAESTAFVGRTAERGRALRCLDAACDGRGSILAIEGEPGIGKTRLIEELIAGARWRGALTLSGDVRGVPEATPLAPLARAVAPALAGAPLARIEAVLDASTRTALAQLHPPWSGHSLARPSPTAGSSHASLSNAMRALGRVVGGLGPAVLALDDVHWAGAELWTALSAFVDGFVSEGGLAVVAYRRPEIQSTDGWAQLRAWDRSGLLTAIPLGPFGLAEVEELIGTSSADPEEILAITGGVPFWITQWSTASARDAPGGDRLGLIVRRLARLTSDQRSALEAAAVVGERVPFAVWADVVQQAPIELAGVGDQLAQAGWIAPSAAGYAFTHDLTRTAVYEQIGASRRRTLHELAARALERREPDNARTRAYHLDCAGRDVEASEMYRIAGDNYLAISAVREAVDAYARAFELQPEHHTRDRLQLALTLAKACESVNDFDRQRPALAAATELARQLGDDTALLRAALIAGLAASRTGDAATSELHLSEARELAERLGDERGVIDATYFLADLRAQQGQWQAAESAWLPLLEYARDVGDLSLEGCVVRGLAIAAKQMGDPQSAVRLLEDSLAVLRRSGDAINELYTSSNLLGALYDLQAWDRLLVHADEMWPIAELFGDPVTLGVVRHQQGLAALALGDHGAAREMMGMAKDAFLAAERPRMAGLVVNTIGLVAEDEGHLDEAESLYRSALETSTRLDAATEAAYARHDLGALLARTGRTTEAIPLLRGAVSAWADQQNGFLRAKSEAHLALALLHAGDGIDEAGALADAGIAIVRSGRREGEQPQGWLWTLSVLLDRLDRPHEAREVLAAARAELDRQARAISDRRLRRQFFEQVPVNRSIVTAHDSREPADSSIVVSLARRDAPLGRALGADERVQVRWTVSAPDDSTIADKGERRRHRLVRLLGEADLAGGAPTDDDLARALGVSRRTILRDVDALAADHPVGSTRRRSRAARR